MKIIKLYFRYFFTKSNLILVLSLVIFLDCSYYLSINNLNESLSYEQVLTFYFENCLYYTKLILVFLTLCIFVKFGNERYKCAINIILPAGFSKIDNFNGLLLSHCFIIFFILVNQIIMYLIVGIISKSYFQISINNVISFFNIYYICLYYGLLCFLLVNLFDNQFVNVILIVSFVISELFIDGDSVIGYVYLFFFPNLNNDGNFIFFFGYIFILIGVLYFFNYRIYSNKDL